MIPVASLWLRSRGTAIMWINAMRWRSCSLHTVIIREPSIRTYTEYSKGPWGVLAVGSGVALRSISSDPAETTTVKCWTMLYSGQCLWRRPSYRSMETTEAWHMSKSERRTTRRTCAWMITIFTDGSRPTRICSVFLANLRPRHRWVPIDL